MTEEKSGEFRGKTVEAAINAGLAALRLSRADVEVEVVRPGSRGVLGIGAEDAVVRLSPVRPAPRVEPRPTPKVDQQPRPTPAARQEPRREPRPETKATAPEPVKAPEPRPALVLSDDKGAAAAEKGREILLGLVQRLNLRAEVEIGQQSDAEVEDGDRAMVLNIVGEDLGVLIGRQNETLSALEFLTRLMVNQQVRTRTNFIVDVNGYRAKRAEALRKLAFRMAEQVVQTNRTMAMEPMPPAERRIIHLALRDHPSVSTQSIGEGDRRKVTLVPKKS
jgi:spoIIIJ-associated protein